MNCKNCNAKIEDGAKFCPSCGSKVEIVEKGDVKSLLGIKNHLEFLGYTVELIEPKKEDDKTMLLATHPKEPNFVAMAVLPGLINLRASFTTEKTHSPKMDAAINEVSSKMDVANVFYDIEDGKATIRIDGMFTGDYSKDLFGQYFSLLTKDIQRTFALESAKKAFVD